MILKYYEFTCDTCGNADYPPCDSVRQGIKYWRKIGGVATRNGRVFCNKKCFSRYKNS